MRAWTAGRLGIGAFGFACVVLLVIGWIAFQRIADLREASRSVDRALMVRGSTSPPRSGPSTSSSGIRFTRAV